MKSFLFLALGSLIFSAAAMANVSGNYSITGSGVSGNVNTDRYSDFCSVGISLLDNNKVLVIAGNPRLSAAFDARNELVIDKETVISSGNNLMYTNGRNTINLTVDGNKLNMVVTILHKRTFSSAGGFARISCLYKKD